MRSRVFLIIALFLESESSPTLPLLPLDRRFLAFLLLILKGSRDRFHAVADNANVYVGAGYSFVEGNGQPTPLGNDDSPVVVVGGEAEFFDSVVVYGDAKWGINAYENSPADAVSLQAGVGYRFN